MIVGKERDIDNPAMDDDGPPLRLRRSDPRSSSFGSRLSTVIRRSLRLAPKRSTTVGTDLGVGKLVPDRESVIEEEEPRRVNVAFSFCII